MDNQLIMYGESDFEDCVRVYVDAFTAPPLCYHWLTKEKAWRYIGDMTRAPGFLGYTYKIGGEMAAFCFGALDNYFEGTVYEVKELAVASAFQHRGVGSAMMGLLETKLAGYGVAAVSLQTSRNLPAFGFYIKNGYEELLENVSLIKWLAT